MNLAGLRQLLRSYRSPLAHHLWSAVITTSDSPHATTQPQPQSAYSCARGHTPTRRDPAREASPSTCRCAQLALATRQSRPDNPPPWQTPKDHDRHPAPARLAVSPPPDQRPATAHPSTGTLTHLPPTPQFPGEHYFGEGQDNTWVLMLRLRLIIRGYADDQRATLEQADNNLTQARLWDDRLRTACTRFQLAQGWRGARANGYPTEETWQQLWTR
ncbi:hypothetical protein J4032_18670 [Streptomyces formicae]|uniref:Peptidoglycan binding-like domain-containing protein n=1 Tax=Streptomyces formicae TaxID=1616117 RepID=A0ABY3WKU1_9ACTN|nr:hypothetical protein [Streptomyces formicae]UNM13103.1 hypothetical protein J4032_17800 [Streptomyces formicae]UNM13243.1 hypothetical protein J4032_18670 [Streptomyces formicae]